MDQKKNPKKVPRIKPYRPQTNLLEQNYSEVLSEVVFSVQKIFKEESDSLQYQQLHQNVYNLVSSKKGEELYQGVCKVITENTQELSQHLVGVHEPQLLKTVFWLWNKHKTSMRYVADVMMYLDSVFVPQNNLNLIYVQGLKCFEESNFRDPQLGPKLKEILIGEVMKDRQGQLIDQNIVKSVVNMLVELGVGSLSFYKKFFEEEFLLESQRFYQELSKEYLSNCSCEEVIGLVTQLYSKEKARVFAMLDTSSEKPLLNLLIGILVEKNKKALIDLGLSKLIAKSQIQELNKMFRLYCKAEGGLEEFKFGVSEYIVEKGSEIVNSPDCKTNPLGMILSILELRARFDLILAKAFSSDPVMESTVKAAFENFINKTQRTAGALAAYLDRFFTKDIKGVSEYEIESQIEKVMIVFRYLKDKDVFENYYKLFLSKRLIEQKSLSDDAERYIVRQLKQECGQQYTSKIEGMLNDVQNSLNDSDTYRVPKIEVRVLTEAYWPIDKKLPILVPQELYELSEVFVNKYTAEHTGRRLVFRNNLGTVQLKANLGKKVYELQVSTCQACVLLLYNNQDSISFESILETIKGDKQELAKHVLGLVKAKVLTKNSPRKELYESTVLDVNTRFASKLLRVKVPLLSSKIKPVEQVPSNVEQERKFVIQATAVRVMKARRTLEHLQLVSEVVKLIQIRFTPEVKDIKNSIENLIERGYITRDQDNLKLYHYVA